MTRRLLAPLSTILLATPALAADGDEFFEKRVRPVLVEHCFKCHSDAGKEPKGGLRVDSRDALVKGGDNGPAVVPGDPSKGTLPRAIGYLDADLQMPQKGKLPDAAIADLLAWIKSGAVWPGSAAPKPEPKKDAFDLAKRKESHWAWKPVVRPAVPAVKDTAWPAGDVDRFVLAKLEAKGIRPAADADKLTLLRRVTFDLTGLPPTPNEIDAFVADASPEAFAKVVDRLLASPRFGERWARHWLDLTRYAESRGHEFEPNIPNAYQYRDYVIRAFNADVPYDTFVKEHVAGDLLPEPRKHPTDGFNESIIGTAFWFLGEEVHSPVDLRQDEADRFDNRLDVMSKTFLGLTVACARCHDHKFDAISQKDYYALAGFINSSNYRLARFDSVDANREAAKKLADLAAEMRPAASKAFAAAVKPGLDGLADYLLAARKGQSLKPDAVAKLAEAGKLDPKRLERWIAALKSSAADVGDPLHAWATAPTDDGPFATFAEQLRKRKPNEGTKIVVDFATAGPDDWRPDDAAYGPAPRKPGDLRFVGDKVVGFQTRTAAVKDNIWDGLKFGPHTEGDNGGLARAPRAGLTIRTPAIPLTTGKLFYLVKGKGLAYASTHSHVVIAGPLHGRLVHDIDTRDRWQWVGHDLSAYQGMKTHIEFTARPGEFAVAAVAQSDDGRPPTDPPGAIAAAIASESPTFVAAAGRVQSSFSRAVEVLADDEIDAASAPLADWMLGHAELFADGAAEAVAKAVEPFAKRRAELTKSIKFASRLVPAMQDGSGDDLPVFIRGNPRTPGEVAQRRFLEALAGRAGIAAPGSGRLELAKQMTDPAVNPFANRVIVNRVWHHLFGRGIVASTDNFGVMGELPTHPELLDHLADQFVRDGWSIKKLIRDLVLSRSYRMSSRGDDAADRLDADNLLLHKARLRRLQGEAIRDAILAVSGELNETMYGPSVPVHLTEFMEGRGRPASGPLDGDRRRSIYLSVRRNFLPPFLLAFDTPTPFSTVGRRTVSNVPAQALILMNDPFVQQQAAIWGKKVSKSAGDEAAKVNAMYRTAFGRPATDAEMGKAVGFVSKHPAGASSAEAWGDLAHALFNVKEFVFLP